MHTRRDFIRAAGLLPLGVGFPGLVLGAAKKARVVIVGGGFSGATVAKYLKMADPGIDVTLIERSAQYISCPFSNEVLSGERDIATLTFDYKAQVARGVNVVTDEVTAVNGAKKTVSTKGGKTFGYDRLVMAPGVAFDYSSIEGAGAEMETTMPHAWKAGEQTLLLKKQIEAMPDGGRAIITVPRRPYRCPPGPYERAAQMALYFKHHKPKAKVLVLDHGDTMAKQPLFEEAWEGAYKGMIDWIPGSSGGKILRVDQAKRLLITDLGEEKADLINFIPPQKAGDIAAKAGLTDQSGWCPVDPVTMESTLIKGIHVIGDAAIAGDMPKSAHSAVSQAKAVSGAILALVAGKPAPTPYYTNTCYSVVAPNYGFSIVGVYAPEGGKITSIKGSGGLTPVKSSAYTLRAEAEYGYSWLKNITTEAFL
jgi:sulfide dehydrogenase [flavocytochrome c] flavoprotein subunit